MTDVDSIMQTNLLIAFMMHYTAKIRMLSGMCGDQSLGSNRHHQLSMGVVMTTDKDIAYRFAILFLNLYVCQTQQNSISNFTLNLLAGLLIILVMLLLIV